MFDNVVENIFHFDRKTGEIISDEDIVSIYPAKYFVTSDEKIQEAIVAIRYELEQRVAELQKRRQACRSPET